MFGKFAGKKTYIVGTLAILSAVAAHLTGDLSAAETGQAVLTAVLGMTIRNGIK